MATLTPPEEAQTDTPDLDAFEHHWQDEADAAYLYRLLADAEPDPAKQDIYRRLADVEDRHLEIWAALLTRHGRRIGLVLPMMLECVEVGGAGLRFFRWGERGHGRNMTSWRRRCRIADIRPVSYTHLTLPTNREV